MWRLKTFLCWNCLFLPQHSKCFWVTKWYVCYCELNFKSLLVGQRRRKKYAEQEKAERKKQQTYICTTKQKKSLFSSRSTLNTNSTYNIISWLEMNSFSLGVPQTELWSVLRSAPYFFSSFFSIYHSIPFIHLTWACVCVCVCAFQTKFTLLAHSNWETLSAWSKVENFWCALHKLTNRIIAVIGYNLMEIKSNANLINPEKLQLLLPIPLPPFDNIYDITVLIQ